MSANRPSKTFALLSPLRQGIWLVGLSSWLFGIGDRTIAALANGLPSAWDLVQVFMAALFFVGWLFLKPMPWRAK